VEVSLFEFKSAFVNSVEKLLKNILPRLMLNF
jgi:hypothetical protein